MSAPATVPYTFPDVPGLALEPMTAVHLNEAAQLEVEAGFKQPCDGDHSQWPADLFGRLPACQGPLSHVRSGLAGDLEAADGWCLRLAFQGRTLQYVILQLDVAAHVAEQRLLLRGSRERPSWFWREAAQPVFAALAAAGVAQFQDWIVPADPTPASAFAQGRRRWLEEHFGAQFTGEWRAGGARCWSMPTDLSRFTSWPARQALGFDQTTGRVRVWEATADELPAVRQLIEDQVPAAERALALRVLEEWWTLDRATLLLGARDGALRYARLVRLRKGTTAGVALVGPLFDEDEHGAVMQAVKAWGRQVGYETLTIFVRDANMAHPKVQALVARSGLRVTTRHPEYREPFTELEVAT